MAKLSKPGTERNIEGVDIQYSREFIGLSSPSS